MAFIWRRKVRPTDVKLLLELEVDEAEREGPRGVLGFERKDEDCCDSDGTPTTGRWPITSFEAVDARDGSRDAAGVPGPASSFGAKAAASRGRREPAQRARRSAETVSLLRSIKPVEV
eukprot:scaffold174432_cov30-Tisochrysis_lutea.AAC.3